MEIPLASSPVDELTYENYSANRERSPEITPERWARIYGPSAVQLEARYQAELAEDDLYPPDEDPHVIEAPLGWNGHPYGAEPEDD